ncbi:hypothetical protein ACGC1H_000330 [Rhizoctonia solani]|uniref:BTB domain-containing protein n=1 Tax=Rhizoctonia solani TaxID=456999 RepID=A0A8H2WXM4_9AGAM|nr:unnamed protein product [Rhizoctonia solani]
MEHEESYTIFVQGEKFTLSHSQITFDSPNYFTTCFLGDFHESQTRSVELTRSPHMFPLIRDYLCGYMVLPLNDHSIPKGMTVTQTISNLKADALFYQLEGLVGQCDEHLEAVQRGLPASHRYLLIGWEPRKNSEPINFRNLNMDNLDRHFPTTRQLGWHLYVTKQEFQKFNIRNMTMRKEFINGGTAALKTLTGLSTSAEKVLPSHGRRRWLVGVINNYKKENEGEVTGNVQGEKGEDKEGTDEDGRDSVFEGFGGEVLVVFLEE